MTRPGRYQGAFPDAEEREGLLTHDADVQQLEVGSHETVDFLPARRLSWRRRLALVALACLGVLLTGSVAHSIYSSSCMQDKGMPEPHPNLAFHGDVLRSNGTHDFRRTVLLVSIDGLRADYLDRGFTPHLLNIAKKGLRAKSMIPVFPTLTFPNHWALMTGLYAESHGIVANNFWDPASQTEFHYNKVESCWRPDWWHGEPMWETAERAGVITANLMWPGPPKTVSGASSTYFIPWRDKVPLQEKLQQIMSWIDLPIEDRPQLILAYEPSLDQAGHATGPGSARVNKTLESVDSFARDLHTELEARNLTDIVDVAFVSDHGMTDTSHPEMVYLDDLLGAEGLSEVEHIDGWPSIGLRFRAGADEAALLARLEKAAADQPERFAVYTHATMPERYHFSHNERIAPIYIVPHIGYVLSTRAIGDDGLNKGSHGYDNLAPSMHAMFVAHGPFSTVARILHDNKAQERPNRGWHHTSDDTYVMESFPNVEVYNLVVRLLGIEADAAPTNGTAGFWDKYL